MSYTVLILALLCCLHSPCALSQSLMMNDTSQATIGYSAAIPLRIRVSTPGDSLFSGTLHLSNATVFFPQTLQSGSHVLDSALTRQNDSTYSVRIPLSADSLQSFVLNGTALSGNDTTCLVRLSGRLDSVGTLLSDSTRLVILSEGTPAGSYVRFAQVSEAWPNPSFDNAPLQWTLRLDKAATVKFSIVDALGRTLFIEERYYSVGSSTFSFSPGLGYYPGSYFLHIDAGSGDVLRRFIIMR